MATFFGGCIRVVQKGNSNQQLQLIQMTFPHSLASAVMPPGAMKGQFRAEILTPGLEVWPLFCHIVING
jgi:hypothetical protein